MLSFRASVEGVGTGAASVPKNDAADDDGTDAAEGGHSAAGSLNDALAGVKSMLVFAKNEDASGADTASVATPYAPP